MSKNKFIKKLLIAGLCALTATATMGAIACKKDGGGEGGGHKHTYEWVTNNKSHWREITCGHDLTDNMEGEHTWGLDDKCTVCEVDRQIIRPTLSEADDDDPEVDENGKITVNYEFNASDYDANTLANNLVSGIYTVGSGTTIRAKTPQNVYENKENGALIKSVNYTKSVKMGGASDLIEIDAPEAGTLVMHVGNGSGNVTSDQLKLTKPDNTTQTISYYGENASGPCIELTLNFTKAGKYKITRIGGTSDIYYMCYTAKVEKSPVNQINVASAGNVDYYVGQSFGTDGLAVNGITTVGGINPIATGRLEIDYQDFDNTTAGTYEVKVSYTKEGSTFNATYNVNVYSFEKLEFGTDKIVKESTNSAAGNGVYANHSLRQLYLTGETLSTDGLSVLLSGKNGTKNNTFLLGNKQYTVSEVDMSTAGKKTVTVSVTTNGVTKQGTFDIYVVAKDSALATASSVNTVVDGSLAEANIGVKNGEGAYQFKTVHQALEFLENCGVKDSAAKTINLAAGTYWEKLEIKIPNLTIVGADKETTKIEYDALYGVKDAGGFEHTTDSTATLNVRDKAVNFTIKNVTISNYYNSLESYNGAPSTDHRALAALIQADKVTVDNCKMLGYQDTVEFFTGRQYIINTYISGTTDFIFGTNNTTYFYGCEIHSISNGSKDGGYVTAFKGNNKGDSDWVQYGAIFDHCHFTADQDVQHLTYEEDGVTVKTVGNTAIGRPWGKYAAVAVINSEIDGHVAKTTSSYNKNERYVSMSGVKPTDSTVKFVEYNNTGAGAISSAVGGMNMLTAEQAANYSDLSVIFGKTNGGVSYSDVWVIISPDAQTHTVSVYAYDGTDTVKLDDLTIEEGKAVLEAQINALVAAHEKYSAYDIVGVYSDSACETEYGYPAITADGDVYVKVYFEKAIVSSTTINFKQDANYATLASSGKLEITAADGVESPYKEIKSDCIGFYKDTEISFKVKAGTTIAVTAYGENYTNYTVKIDGVLKTDLTGADENTGVLTGDVEFTVDNDCTVTIVCGGSTSIADCNYLKGITINVPKTYGHENIDLMQYDGGELSATKSGKWNGIEISGGKFSKRAANNDIQCEVGTTLTFKVEEGITKDDITVISYQDTPVAEGTWEITVENGVATIECKATTSNHQYIKAIQIA